jgi:hypothetical protein
MVPIGKNKICMYSTPIVLFIFNRPKNTFLIISILRNISPQKLFIIADGPRPNNESDVLLCEQTRKVIDGIDWPCEIIKKYANSNIGCRNSIPQGLDFVFQQVESCVILEDDCIPQLSFFQFCEELLHIYKDNKSIMTISGHRSEGPNEFDSDSYFFSIYPAIWGWATWKNRWEKYDLSMSQWPELRRSNWLNRILKTHESQSYWTRIFNKMQEGLDTWDYAWVFASWVHQGLTIRPKINMITNVGFNEEATHTNQKNHEFKFPPACELVFPLKHPTQINIDEKADHRIEWVSFSGMDIRRIAIIRENLMRQKGNKNA